MAKLSLLGAAALLSSLLASPVMAQEVISDPGYCAQFYPNANCDNLGPGNPYTGGYQRSPTDRSHAALNDSYNRWDGGAAPIGGDAYLRQNGFVCRPGTWFRGADGQRHLCQ